MLTTDERNSLLDLLNQINQDSNNQINQDSNNQGTDTTPDYAAIILKRADTGRTVDDTQPILRARF